MMTNKDVFDKVMHDKEMLANLEWLADNHEGLDKTDFTKYVKAMLECLALHTQWQCAEQRYQNIK